jgi:hypothetical protein
MTELFTPFNGPDQMPMRKINPITNASEEIEQEVTAGMTLGCLYCITDVTVAMTEKHCREDEHIWIDKLAQMRNVYPEYFDRFTQTKAFQSRFPDGGSIIIWAKDGNWEVPENIRGTKEKGAGAYSGPISETVMVYDYEFPWGQYLIDHPDIKAAYGKDDILFFKTFFTEFIKYVNTVIVDDEEFWEKFNRGTPVQDIFTQLKADPIFHLQSISVEKRGLALKIMTENYNKPGLLGGKEPSYLRLLSSFIADRQAAAMLKYIEDSIKVRKIYDLFVTGDKPKLYQVGVLMALSNMITGSGHYNYSEDVLGDLLISPELVAEVEADLFQFKNAGITFSADNKLFINARLYDYNDYVSVKVAGSFEMNGQMIAKGQLLQMPAIQVALMASVAKMEQTEKQVSLAFDVGLMVIGVGEAKIFLSAGKYIQKAILLADMVGSATDITTQLINYDALGEKWRTTLQIATFALSLPSMVQSIPKVEKYIEDLDELLDLRRKGNALGKEIGELERIGGGLCDVAGIPDYIADGRELLERAVSMDKEADIVTVTNRLEARGDVDNNIYIVIHGKGSKFNVIHNGEDLEMNHRSLAIWIKKQGFPADKQLVLLSCANMETAKNVARKAKVSLVANDGVVKVYDNGVIEAENGFKYIDKNGNIDESRKVVIGEQKAPGGGMIRLGKEETGLADDLKTVNGRVTKPAASDKYGSFVDDSKVPEVYRTNPERFADLAFDPATAKTTSKTRQEAMAGLELEKQGVIKGPIVRGPEEIEFFDADGTPWDVKGPPSKGGKMPVDMNCEQSSKSIIKELTEKEDIVNPITGKLTKRHVILDCTFMTPKDHAELWMYLKRDLPEDALKRIFEVNIKL